MRQVCFALGFALIFAAGSLAGDLNPPAGPVAATPGPEARTPLSATTTPGDADSVFRIATGGSYYLTGDVHGETAKHAIEIDSSDVTLDLNGFSIIGAFAAGTLDGIHVTNQRFAITIRNGLVWGFGEDGVDGELAYRSRIVEVTSTNNGARGIAMDDRSHIVDCIADTNGTDGIVVNDYSMVSGCTSTGNSGIGINVAGGRSRISDCAVLGNGDFGVLLGFGSTIERCTVSANFNTGIQAGESCRVIDCVADANTHSGIFVESNSVVMGNSCDNNSLGDPSVDAGIDVAGSTGDTKVEGNTCTRNDIGFRVLGAGNLIVGNTAAGNRSTSFAFSGAQFFGPIITSSSGLAGAGAWANIQY